MISTIARVITTVIVVSAALCIASDIHEIKEAVSKSPKKD